MRGIHWWPVNSTHKGPAILKMFPFDNAIIGAKFLISLLIKDFIHSQKSCIYERTTWEGQIAHWATRLYKVFWSPGLCDIMLMPFLALAGAWWRHQMETFYAILAICAGNSPVPGEFPAQRPVTRSFDVFFDLCPNKRLSKQWWGWWFETPSSPLRRHCNGIMGYFLLDDQWASARKM